MDHVQSHKHYPAFDYLRIVLAIVVAVGHSGLIVWEPAGNYSVQVFFALSGWLIGGILLRSAAVLFQQGGANLDSIFCRHRLAHGGEPVERPRHGEMAGDILLRFDVRL
jgi:hypothetical protein